MDISTKQKIFDRAFAGLESQGFERSISQYSGRCQYRSGNGLKCAVGHCLTDDNYNPSFEGFRASQIDIQKAIALSMGINLSGDPDGFLLVLQDAHDFANSPDDMRRALYKIAADNHLSVTVRE